MTNKQSYLWQVNVWREKIPLTEASVTFRCKYVGMNFGGRLCKFIRFDLSRLWRRGGPVPSKNMQTLPSEVSIFTWKIPTVLILNQMKNHISDFFKLWLIAFIIYGDAPGVPLSLTKQFFCSKVDKFTGKMRIDLTMIF